MTLADFKTIYWWEWSHRLLARADRRRVSAAVPLVPVARLDRAASCGRGCGRSSGSARRWARSAGGWWRPGLPTASSVSQYRLAFHLTLACVIFAAIVVDGAAARAARDPRSSVPARIRASAMALLVLVLVQIYLGALVAGLRAGLIYNTWPLIDGSLVPDAARLFFEQPWWRNLFENRAHRAVRSPHGGLCAVVVAALLHAVDVARTARRAAAFAARLRWPPSITAAGGARHRHARLSGADLGLALAHQAMAIVVLTDRGRARRSASSGAMPSAAGAAAAQRGEERRHDRASRIHGDVAVLRMAHGKANAMSTEFCRSADRAVRASCGRAPARAVVLTGTGRIFSAGVDLLRAARGRRALCPRIPAGA